MPNHQARPPTHGRVKWKPAPPTDPVTTNALWNTVRSASGSSNSRIPVRTQPPRQANRPGRRQGQPNAEIPPSPPTSTPVFDAESITASVQTDVTKTTATSRRKNIGPRDSGFEEKVLIPHGIRVNNHESPEDADVFFGTIPTENYSQLPELEHHKLWLRTDEASLVSTMEEYRAMNHRELCEDEYASFAKEELLKATRRAYKPPGKDKLRVERMVCPTLTPSKKRGWLKPPKFDDAQPDWTWDLQPDCTYWVSLESFNERWRHRAKSEVYVNEVVTCPYFTVEFKRDDETTEDVAINQVAAAGAIALYNRYCLHQKAIQRYNRLDEEERKDFGWEPTPQSQLMHFGLTFVGSNFRVWVLRPIADESTGDWRGCTMEGLMGARCKDSLWATKELLDWINEIHRWGLMKHAPACRDEIKVCLKARCTRVSAIGAGSSK